MIENLKETLLDAFYKVGQAVDKELGESLKEDFFIGFFNVLFNSPLREDIASFIAEDREIFLDSYIEGILATKGGYYLSNEHFESEFDEDFIFKNHNQAILTFLKLDDSCASDFIDKIKYLVVRHNPEIISIFPERVRYMIEEEMAKKAAASDEDFLSKTENKKWKKNVSIAEICIRKNHNNYHKVSEELQSMVSIASLALNEGLHPFLLSAAALSDEEIAYQVIDDCGEYFGILPPELRRNPNFIKKACESYPLAIQWVDKVDESLVNFALECCESLPDKDEAKHLTNKIEGFRQKKKRTI